MTKNEIATTKPMSDRTMSTVDTQYESIIPMSDRTMSTVDTQFESTMESTCEPQNTDKAYHNSNDSFFRRIPPERTSLTTIKLALAVVTGDGVQVDESIQEKVTMLDDRTAAKPFKRISLAKKLQIRWPPLPAESITKEKAVAKKTLNVATKPASTVTIPLYFSSSSEKSSSPLPSVLESKSSLSSLSHRDSSVESSQKKIGRSLHSQRRGIKAKIDMYENMCHKSRDSLNNMKCSYQLQPTYLGDTAQCNDLEDSQEVLVNISLSPGHNLPKPKGYKKHRRISYRIRFGIPDLENSDDQDVNDCDSDGKDVSKGEGAGSRGGGIRGICGFNRSSDWVSWEKSVTETTKIDREDEDRENGDIIDENDTHYTTDEQSEKKSDTSCGGYHHPDVWVTPIKSKDGSRKWIAKRVWDIEDKDDEEPEYLVDHLCLMDGVRGLMGIPEEMGMTSDEWQINIDESDPWEMTADKDSMPIFPTRTRDNFRAPLYVKKVIDVDGQYEESSRSLLLDEENYHTQLEHITELSLDSLTDLSDSFDSDSDGSIISLIDYFDDSDASSISVSLPTHSTDHSYQFSSKGDPGDHEKNEGKLLYKNERPEDEPGDHDKTEGPFFNSPDRGMTFSMNQLDLTFCPESWKIVLNGGSQGAAQDANNASNTQSGTRSLGANWDMEAPEEEIIFGSEDAGSESDEDELDEVPRYMTTSDRAINKEKTNARVFHHNKRGFGRPDEWIRPNGAYEVSSRTAGVFHHNEIGFGRPDEWIRQNDAYGDSSEFNHHKERGFGRPDDWIRPNDAYEESSVSTKCNHHKERGFGRPNDWIRPNDAYEEYSESTKCNHHDERGFGRPDDWIKSNDAYEESSESTKYNHHNEIVYGKPNDCVRLNDAHKESSKSTKCNHHNERGFGRPDEWIRPNDAYEESSESTKCKHHNERGLGRPNNWMRPNDAYEQSLECGKRCRRNEKGFGIPHELVRPIDGCEETSECSKPNRDKCYHHNERGFGRPVEWIRPTCGYEGSSECRSWRSLVTSRTAQDKSVRESSPEEDSAHNNKGDSCTIDMDECKTLVENLLVAHKNVVTDCESNEAQEYRGKKNQKRKKKKNQKRKKIMKQKTMTAKDKSSSRVTHSVEDDPKDERKRGTPTWEKVALQQEEESEIKLWWQF